MSTQLVFVLGSGRCGTKLVGKVLSGQEHIRAEHEFVRDSYQREASLYSMGLLSENEMSRILRNIYGSMSAYCQKNTFVDSSNKLVNVADLLPRIFPDAKFVHLYRDGRKVVSSFYNKLGANIYNDRGVEILSRYVDEPEVNPVPPPPEEFWWPLPSDPVRRASFRAYDQFQRICYHWERSNRKVRAAIGGLPDAQKLEVSLESLVSDEGTASKFCSFLGIEYDANVKATLAVPTHVYIPMEFGLTDLQNEQFLEICGEMMDQLGYDVSKPSYRMKY